ncbi:MAG: DUF1207 domain-containing protein [Lacipirellulaceae bacterium]
MLAAIWMTACGWSVRGACAAAAASLAIAGATLASPAVDPFLVADQRASASLVRPAAQGAPSALRQTTGYGAASGALAVDPLYGEPMFAQPLVESPLVTPTQYASAPYESKPYESKPYESAPYESAPYESAQPGTAPYGAEQFVVEGDASMVDVGAYDAGGWDFEMLPDGIIYRSYLAGPRESRIGTLLFHNESSAPRSELLWDGTVGGRRGLFRYGNGNPADPEGWQLDVEGAALVRLNLDENRDVDSSDFRFGVPLTYGEGDTQYKFGYYHLSSHLGDERIGRTGVNSRLNYVRDAIIFGVSHELTPAIRVYGETAFAFFTAGGAEPWEFQFGAEYAQPGPTGNRGTPFVATNAHLREELDFGGDWTFQTGWLWRGVTGSTFRAGVQYVNGKSTQYQFFDRNEEQVGLGFWYDF